jgi:hypothetical protein
VIPQVVARRQFVSAVWVVAVQIFHCAAGCPTELCVACVGHIARGVSNRQFWVGTWQECEWKAGASWKLMIPDGRVGDSGEVLEIDPPKRLVLSWRNEFKPELHEEGLFAHDLHAGTAG